jgi:choline monooxygenase
MDAVDLKEELARFPGDTPIERAWMPPSSWYTTAAFDRLEREAVFASTWQPVARVAELREPGSYASGCLAGQPWVIIRGEDGELQCFHNTCRHKGREIVEGSGQSSELVCGYHAWTYDLTGRLKSAPQMGGVEDFDRERMSLASIAVQEWGLWAFINLSPDAHDLAVTHSGLQVGLGNPDWGALKYHGGQTWRLECNWKVVCDNYLDGGYHIPHMHPSLDAQLDMQSYRTELFPTYSIQTAPPNKGEDERIEFDAKSRIGDAARYVWVYPNFMLNRYGPCVDSNLVIPRGPNACEVHYEFFFLETEEDVAKGFLEESIAQSEVTQREDIAICESVQRGLQSSSYDTGRYAPRVETGEHHFHQLLAAALKAAAR